MTALCRRHCELQKKMLDVCANFGASMEIKYNCKKNMVIRIGSHFNNVCKPLKLCGVKLSCCLSN